MSDVVIQKGDCQSTPEQPINQLLPQEKQWLQRSQVEPIFGDETIATANLDMLRRDINVHLETETINVYCNRKIQSEGEQQVRKHLQRCNADCCSRIVALLREEYGDTIDQNHFALRIAQEAMLRQQIKQARLGTVEQVVEKEGGKYRVSLHEAGGKTYSISAVLPYFAAQKPEIGDDVLVWLRRVPDSDEQMYWILLETWNTVKMAEIPRDTSRPPLTRAQRIAPIL